MSCYFDDPAFTIVSLVFTLIPLAVSVLIAAILVIVIWRFSDTKLERTGWCLVKTKRFGRFGALVSVTMISAALYTAALSQWVRMHRDSTNDSGGWTIWLNIIRASVFWEGSFAQPSA